MFRRSPLGRALLLALVLPLCILGVFSLTTAYKIYASNQEERALTVVPPAIRGQRLLVFAPHPDDETLGAAGLMRQARLKGDDVRVVIITNGDGFRLSAERMFHKISVTPKDFIRYAYLRQDEARTALGVLKIPSDHVVFLGYPDRGLMPMWLENWSSQKPFESFYTQTSDCPYADSPTPHAPYCGQYLLQDIKRQMLADRPTDIFVTHPNDDHPDHAAASVFVRAAFEQIKAAGVPWAQTAHLHYYLVHRGDWPTPQGLHENAGLAPPGQMAALDTQWQSLPLSHQDIQRKYAALMRYHSQVDLTSRFLFSFVRQNELFGTLRRTDAAPILAHVPDGQIRMDGDGKDWTGVSPISLEPVGDSVGRVFQSSGDVARLYACRDNHFLYVRMDAHGTLSPRVAYRLTVRPIVPGDFQPPALAFNVLPADASHVHPLPGVTGGTYSWRGTLLEAAIPLTQPGLIHLAPHQTLYVMAQTRIADIEIDRTGFRAVVCGPAFPPAHLTASR